MNPKGYITIILILTVVVLVGIAGYFVLLRMPTKLETPKSENQGGAEAQKVVDYSKLDFFETLIEYYKIRDSQGNKEIVIKALETKADVIIKAGNRNDFGFALKLIAQTKDPVFYEYFLSVIEQFKKDEEKLGVAGFLAILGDQRGISVAKQYENISDLYAPVNSAIIRMRLGDESMLKRILEYSRDDRAVIKKRALTGLGYSHSREATDRLNEVINKNEDWSLYARLALEQQKLNALAPQEKGLYLLSIRQKIKRSSTCI